jgi:predicted permease
MLSVIRSFFGMISAFSHSRKFEDRLRDELQLHIDLLAEKNMRLGMTHDEAQRHARIAVGGFDQTSENVCDARGVRWLHALHRNYRYALRVAWKQKALSITVIGLLAFASGANFMVFSFYNSLFVRPLPFPDAERLVDLDETAPKWNQLSALMDYTDFDVWRKENRTFDAMGLFWTINRSYSRNGNASYISVIAVTYDFPSVFQIQPVLGRNFLEEEDHPFGFKAAMLSYEFWQREFGGSRSVLGETLQLDGELYSVVGVLPKNVDYPTKSDLWVPLQWNAYKLSRGYWFRGTGRLKKGVTLTQAQEDLARIHRNMINIRPVNNITSPRLQFLREKEFGGFRSVIKIFQAAGGILLLIACANIAGMMLARSESRSREIGIRTALGASSARIIRQHLTESLLLAIPGMLLGLPLGNIFLKLAILWLGELPPWIKFTADIRIFAFCGLLMGTTSIFFGLAPALQAARVDVQRALHETSIQSSASNTKRRGLDVLVVGEIALAFVMLVGAGLLLRTWQKAQAVDPGFQVKNILAFRIDLPQRGYKHPADWTQFFEQFLRRCRQIPGVLDISGAMPPPLSGMRVPQYFEIEGAPPRHADEPDPPILKQIIFPGYFKTMGMLLVSGRAFIEEDGRTKGTVIVNQSFARRFWPNADPIGKRIRYRDEAGVGQWLTVVGISRDNKEYGLDQPTPLAVYYPFNQSPNNAMYIVIRSTMDPARLLSPVRAQLREMDPELPLLLPMTMTEAIDKYLKWRRILSFMMALCSASALLIAAAGIYGVVSYTVSRRSQEIGIRMALGATRSQVLSMVVSGGTQLVIAGAAFGIAGAVAASQFLRSFLFGVTSLDTPTYLLVSVLLIGVVIAASLLPARRAASIDPMLALRSE